MTFDEWWDKTQQYTIEMAKRKDWVLEPKAIAMDAWQESRHQRTEELRPWLWHDENCAITTFGYCTCRLAEKLEE